MHRARRRNRGRARRDQSAGGSRTIPYGASYPGEQSDMCDGAGGAGRGGEVAATRARFTGPRGDCPIAGAVMAAGVASGAEEWNARSLERLRALRGERRESVNGRSCARRERAVGRASGARRLRRAARAVARAGCQGHERAASAGCPNGHARKYISFRTCPDEHVLRDSRAAPLRPGGQRPMPAYSKPRASTCWRSHWLRPSNRWVPAMIRLRRSKSGLRYSRHSVARMSAWAPSAAS